MRESTRQTNCSAFKEKPIGVKPGPHKTWPNFKVESANLDQSRAGYALLRQGRLVVEKGFVLQKIKWRPLVEDPAKTKVDS